MAEKTGGGLKNPDFMPEVLGVAGMAMVRGGEGKGGCGGGFRGQAS
jgi:hypothetical protein